MLLLFLMCAYIYGKGCLNNEGTVEIIVKIYVDHPSQHGIANYVHATLPHKFTTPHGDHHIDSISAHIKHYFGTIFNIVNRTLVGTNVQFKADFSDMNRHEFSEIHERYCGYFKSITDMTEGFLNDLDSPHTTGQNRIVVMSCSDNNPPYHEDTHMASKNTCGKIFGVLYNDPEVMKHNIVKGIFSYFTAKSISQVSGVNEAILADICAYVQACNRNFDFKSLLALDAGLLTHNTFTEGDRTSGYGYGLVGRFVKDFKHQDDRDFHADHIDEIGHSTEHSDHGGHGGHPQHNMLDHNDGHYHKRHRHDEESCHVNPHHSYHHLSHGHNAHHDHGEGVFMSDHFNEGHMAPFHGAANHNEPLHHDAHARHVDRPVEAEKSDSQYKASEPES